MTSSQKAAQQLSAKLTATTAFQTPTQGGTLVVALSSSDLDRGGTSPHSQYTNAWAVLMPMDGGRSITINSRTILGRCPSANIRIDDDRISSVHCEFSREDNVEHGPFVVIEDKSVNGTFVNARKVGKGKRCRLVGGDEIGLVMLKRHRGSHASEFLQRYIFQDFLSSKRLQRTTTQPVVTHCGTSGNENRVIHWQKGNILGQGATGSVFLGINTDTGEFMAVKELRKPKARANNDGASSPSNSFALTPMGSPANSEQLMQCKLERDMLKALAHQRIVRYLAFEEDDQYFRILLEYVSGGSIQSLLERFGYFQESVVRLYALQILQGLDFLHVQGVVHGDIKPGNILVDERGGVKLSDFGTCHVIDANRPVEEIRGTPLWMSPELAHTGQPTVASDVWAFGGVVLEMVTGERPWSEKHFENTFQIIYHLGSTNEGPSLDGLSGSSLQLRHFVSLCFHFDAAKRPTISQLMQHPFIVGDSSQSVVRTTSTDAAAVGVESHPLFVCEEDGAANRVPMRGGGSTAGDHAAFLRMNSEALLLRADSSEKQVAPIAPGKSKPNRTTAAGALPPPDPTGLTAAFTALRSQ